MPRVVLVHWDEKEAPERLDRLRRAGFDAQLGPLASEFRTLRENPPDAVVIDLSRRPSHGREVAGALRRWKATRSAALVFVGGEAEPVARTRSMLPDAVFTDWPQVAAALKKALRSAPAMPVVPDTMAGYSGTPLPKKLGLKPGTTVALLGAPPGFEAKLEPLPEGVRVSRRAGHANRVLLFVKSAAELRDRFEPATSAVEEGGGLWIVWPKKASGIKCDVGEIEVRKYGLDRGWVDYKICAVDETWSGLQFARRGERAARTGK